MSSAEPLTQVPGCGADDSPVQAGVMPVPPTAAPLARPARSHPLGPLVRMVRLENAVLGRLYSLGVILAATGVMVAAWRIHPGSSLMGTHRQLGLPPCGFLQITGLPCPTCGMTTAFAHTVRGEFRQAVRSQLAGFILAIGTVLAGAAGLLAMATGRRPSLNWYRINPLHTIWWGAGVFVLAWALKMTMGLMDGTLPQRGMP